MKNKLYNLFRLIYYILRSIINDIKLKVGLKEYPTVVNFSLTNLCNCKCEMCNVWKKENREKNMMSAKEIGKLFSSELFKKMKHAGLSGGEPFIRKDIAEVIKEITSNSKSLKSISIISNGTLKNRIVKLLPEVIDVCNKNNINFSIMFSIDGVGKTHNKIRGNELAFKNLNALLDNLEELGIEYSLCTTIVKDNVDELYNILNYAKNRNVYIKYRVATEITRLYNSDLKDNYQFNRSEKIKIAKFLEGLMNNYEKSLNQKLLYESLKEHLINGTNRKVGCTWKNKGISLDPDGNLYYCFAKSPKLGSAIEDEGAEIYFSNIDSIRKNIIKNKCKTCHHDYNGIPPTKTMFKYFITKFKPYFKKISYRALYLLSTVLNPIIKRITSKNTKKLNDIYITGWYGTETLGDKAILGGILDNLSRISDGANFIISSIVPYYSEETMEMLKNNEVFHSNKDSYQVIGKNLIQNIKAIKKSDIVVMGGGPLMEIENVNNIYITFIIAKLLRKKTIIYNCGLGPLKSKRLKSIVKKTLEISDLVILRDQLSADNYPELVENIDYEVCIDPAVNFLLNNKKKQNKTNKSYILMSIRDWPLNYCKKENDYDFIKEKFENSMADLIDYLTENYDVEIILFPMHTYFIGHDDRDFFQGFIEKLNSKKAVNIYEKDYNISEAIELFENAKILVGMRFHSVVFGNTLSIPTLSIDYDSNIGKVTGFNRLINNNENVIPITNVNSELLIKKFNNIYEKTNKDTKEMIYNILNNRAKKSDNIVKEFILTGEKS
jgi:polysaccharide pyruvyl transferase WcaK-like protein/MoaA/NifB/PqqE/SkfB family radical SAM enzyme